MDAARHDEHALAANRRDPDLPGVTGEIGQAAEDRIEVRERDAFGELHGFAPAGTQHDGDVGVDVAELTEVFCCCVVGGGVETIATSEFGLQLPSKVARKAYKRFKQNTSDEAGVLETRQ